MRTDELGPELTSDVRLASAWYNLSPAQYVRIVVRRALDELCDFQPLLREAMEMKRR